VLGSGPPGERGPLLSRRRRPVRRTDARRPGRDDAPFTAIDSATVDAVGERIAAADVTVLADPVIDPAATLCRLAEAAERLVVVESRPLAERNYAGERGRQRYETLRRRARVVDADRVPTVLDEKTGPGKVVCGRLTYGRFN